MLRREQPAVVSYDRRLRFRRAIQILSPAHVLRHGFELGGYRHRHVCAPTEESDEVQKGRTSILTGRLGQKETHVEPEHRSAIPGPLTDMHHYSVNSVYRFAEIARHGLKWN